MKVISTTDLSREGNDCYIYKSISLVEALGMYTVIDAEKVIGSWDKRDISCTHTTSDLDTAKYLYKQLGGEI